MKSAHFYRITFFLILLYGSTLAQQFAQAEQGMVVTSTPQAAMAGLTILKAGGNAVDAAAATAFALMVTDPAMCSLAGRSQILIYLNEGRAIGIDGATETPGNVGEAVETGRGYKTVPVPGSPAALQEMVDRFGTLSLDEVMAPAIALARDGFIINAEYQRAFKKYGKDFRDSEGALRHFLKKDGDIYREGERFIQPALATTLEKIARNGSGILYDGELASVIVDDMNRNGGLVGMDDLRRYRTKRGVVLEGKYRGYRVLSRGDQCDGASLIEMLNLLEYFDLSAFSRSDYRYTALLAQINHIAYMDEYLPDWIQTAAATAERRYREIRLDELFPVTVKPKKDPHQGETNHLSVIDKQGNCVSITQSIGPYFGAKVVNADLGFFYAYSYDMNSDPVPFQREKTSQTPTIVLQESRPFMIIGSAGSSRIPGSIFQTIVNVIDHKMDLEKAVGSPRIFLLKDELRVESGILSEKTFSDLENLGYRLKVFWELNGWFGRVHAIHLPDSDNGIIHGAADPRDFGAAMGY